MKRITDPEQMNLYLSDESRRVGTAQEIFFPDTEEDIRQLLQADKTSAVTTQGGRTGVTAGAVPNGGMVLNLSAMNRVLRLPLVADDLVSSAPSPQSVLVQPGVLLCHLQELLGREHVFFPPDPTETTASIGGMVNCNSSGARTFRYGATRDHILALRMVLSDGDTLSIRRGECFAKAGQFSLETMGGRTISGSLPDIQMPRVSKSTAGYYIRPDMDMIDLFIGSEGTLGIVTEIECSVLPEPKELWGTIIFLDTEAAAIRFVRLLRGEQVTDPCSGGEHGQPLHPEAIEFFGTDTLDMLRESQAAGDMLTDMTEIPSGCAVYTEFASDSRRLLEPLCRALGEMISQAGGDPDRSWFAFRGPDMKRLKDFRHAAPVCVNERISQIRKTHPTITKLGTDMSVPDTCLEQVFTMYREDLAKEGFQTSLFGHIGNNHLHCNILPRNEDEYERGKELYTRWAGEVVRMGGSVSAEHGIGKLKPWLLRKLYTEKELQSMLELKALFDPEMRLNPGNIFGAPATSL